MGFFDKMKSMAGIGSPKLTLDVDSPEFVSEQRVAGSVLIAAQERPTVIKSVTITLVSEHKVRRADGAETTHHAILGETVMPFPEGHQFAAQEKARFMFELEVGAVALAEGVSYELRATADAPGLDPKTSIPMTLVERSAEGVELAPISREGLIAVRSSFVGPLADCVGDDEIMLIPRYGEAAYEASQTFEAPNLDDELLEALHGRVVMMSGGSAGSAFGLLVRSQFPGTYAILGISSLTVSTSYCNAANAGRLSLVRFVAPSGDELTRDDLVGDLNIDRAVLQAQLDELERLYPDA